MTQTEEMVVAAPVDADDDTVVGHSWGKTPRLVVARVRDGQVVSRQVHDVRWDLAHDAGGHGSHHAGIARFLLDHQVAAVVAGHMGPPMVRMLTTMNLRVLLGVEGPLDAALVQAARSPEAPVVP